MYVSPEAVWNRLMDSDSYETPLIREWMPYVTKQLVEKQLSSRVQVLPSERRHSRNQHGQANLDDIVIEGLKNGSIRIP